MSKHVDPASSTSAGGDDTTTTNEKIANQLEYDLPFDFNFPFELKTTEDWKRKGFHHPRECGGFAAICKKDRAPKRYATFCSPSDDSTYSRQLCDWWVEIAWKDTMCLQSSMELMEQEAKAAMRPFMEQERKKKQRAAKKAAKLAAGEDGAVTEDDEDEEDEEEDDEEEKRTPAPRFSAKIVTFDVYGKAALFITYRDHIEKSLHFLVLYVNIDKAPKLHTALSGFLRSDFKKLMAEIGEIVEDDPEDDQPGYAQHLMAVNNGQSLLKSLFRLERYVKQLSLEPTWALNKPHKWVQLVDAKLLRQFPKLRLLLYDVVTIALSRYKVVVVDDGKQIDGEDALVPQALLFFLTLFFPLHRILHASGAWGANLSGRHSTPAGPTAGLQLQGIILDPQAKETPEALLASPEMTRLVEDDHLVVAGCCIFINDAIKAAKKASLSGGSDGGSGASSKRRSVSPGDLSAPPGGATSSDSIQQDGMGGSGAEGHRPGGAPPWTSHPWRQFIKVTSSKSNYAGSGGNMSNSASKSSTSATTAGPASTQRGKQQGGGVSWDSLGSNFQPYPMVVDAVDFIIAQVNSDPLSGLGSGTGSSSGLMGNSSIVSTNPTLLGAGGAGPSFGGTSSFDAISMKDFAPTENVFKAETVTDEQKLHKKRLIALYCMNWKKSLVEVSFRQYERLAKKGLMKHTNEFGIVATTLQMKKRDLDVIVSGQISELMTF